MLFRNSTLHAGQGMGCHDDVHAFFLEILTHIFRQDAFERLPETAMVCDHDDPESLEYFQCPEGGLSGSRGQHHLVQSQRPAPFKGQFQGFFRIFLSVSFKSYNFV